MNDNIINTLITYTMSLDPVARTRVGAVLVYKRRIVAFGHNRYKSHPMQARFGRNENSIFLHAENDCLRNYLRLAPNSSLSRSSLIVCRVKRVASGKHFILGIAKPCSGCQRAIVSFNIPHVFYTGDDQRIHRLCI